MRENTLYLVVPCYNEEEVLEKTAEVLHGKMRRLMSEAKISDKSKILFVNDGSKDQTWNIIYQFYAGCLFLRDYVFLRNFGHQSAILAGMMAAKESCGYRCYNRC